MAASPACCLFVCLFVLLNTSSQKNKNENTFYLRLSTPRPHSLTAVCCYTLLQILRGEKKVPALNRAKITIHKIVV